MAPAHDFDGELPVQICWEGMCKDYLVLCEVITAAVAQCRLPPNSDGTGLLLHIQASKRAGSCSLEGTSIAPKPRSIWKSADTEVSVEPDTVSVRANRIVRTFSTKPIYKSFIADWLKQRGLLSLACVVFSALATISHFLSILTSVHDQGCVVRHPALLYCTALCCIPIWILVASITSWQMFKALFQEFDCLLVLFWGTVLCLTGFVNDQLSCDAYAQSMGSLNMLRTSGESLNLVFVTMPTRAVAAYADAIAFPGKFGEVLKTACYAFVFCNFFYLNISARFLNQRIWYTAELSTWWFGLSTRQIYITASTQICIFVGKMLFVRLWYSRWYVILKTPMVPCSSQEDCTLAFGRHATEDTERRNSGIDPAQEAKADWQQHDATSILPGQALADD